MTALLDGEEGWRLTLNLVRGAHPPGEQRWTVSGDRRPPALVVGGDCRRLARSDRSGECSSLPNLLRRCRRRPLRRVPRANPISLVETNIGIFVHLALDDTLSGRTRRLTHVGTGERANRLHTDPRRRARRRRSKSGRAPMPMRRIEVREWISSSTLDETLIRPPTTRRLLLPPQVRTGRQPRGGAPGSRATTSSSWALRARRFARPADYSVASIGPPPRSRQPATRSQVVGGATGGPYGFLGGSNPRRHASLHQPSKYQADE
jgi:hypothetical protein